MFLYSRDQTSSHRLAVHAGRQGESTLVLHTLNEGGIAQKSKTVVLNVTDHPV